MTPSTQEVSQPTKTCKRGHCYDASERQCPVCKKASHDLWVEENKDYLAKHRHEHYLENRAEILRKDKEYREKNYEEYMKRVKRYRTKNKEAIRERAKNKMEEFPEYSPWANLNTRCNNPLATGYENYGGRGIKVCDRWQGKGGFKNFLKDVGRRPSLSHSIERLDVNGNYEPGNCVWATPRQQSRNMRRNIFIEFNGKRQCLTDWAADLGMATQVLYNRIFYGGMSIEVALTRPLGDDIWHKKKTK